MRIAAGSFSLFFEGDFIWREKHTEKERETARARFFCFDRDLIEKERETKTSGPGTLEQWIYL